MAANVAVCYRRYRSVTICWLGGLMRFSCENIGSLSAGRGICSHSKKALVISALRRVYLKRFSFLKFFMSLFVELGHFYQPMDIVQFS